MTQTRKRFLKQWILGEFSFLRLLRSSLLIYACICLYVFFFADRQAFLPPPSSYQDSAEILKIPTSDSVQLSAIYLPNPTARYTILYSHGNAEDLGQVRPRLQQFYEAGFAVLAYDYRGYGTSGGRPTEANSYRDIVTVYRYLTDTLQVPAAEIVAYGRSLGGAISIDLAAHQPLGGLIVENTFTSGFRVYFPVPIFPFEKFHSIGKIPQIKCPILILHGTADRLIPISHGKALYAVAPEPKQFWAVEGAGHNDLAIVAGDRYIQQLQAFLRP